jgi:hypothetical protein
VFLWTPAVEIGADILEFLMDELVSAIFNGRTGFGWMTN